MSGRRGYFKEQWEYIAPNQTSDVTRWASFKAEGDKILITVGTKEGGDSSEWCYVTLDDLLNVLEVAAAMGRAR